MPFLPTAYMNGPSILKSVPTRKMAQILKISHIIGRIILLNMHVTFDMKKFDEQSHKLWTKCEHSTGNALTKALLEYYLFLTTYYEEGIIGP